MLEEEIIKKDKKLIFSKMSKKNKKRKGLIEYFIRSW